MVQQYTYGRLRLAESDRNNVKDNANADADESEREGCEEGGDESTNLLWCLRHSVQRKAAAS